MSTVLGASLPDWRHEWNFDVVDLTHDVEGAAVTWVTATILAGSGEEAEARALSYVRGNYDDGGSFYKAEAATDNGDGTFLVDLYFTRSDY